MVAAYFFPQKITTNFCGERRSCGFYSLPGEARVCSKEGRMIGVLLASVAVLTILAAHSVRRKNLTPARSKSGRAPGRK